MIYKKCVMTIEKNKATLDEDIYLYRLDKNIELYFTIVNNKYRFNKSDMNNIIMMTNAAFFQVRLYKNAEIKYTFAIQPTDGGQAILTITDDLIDDPIEVGDYDFQISLLDEEKTSMISMPIVSKQLHVCEPLVSDDATMGKAILGLSKLATGEIKNAFDSEGNYIREIHKDGDILSASIINKFEDALDSNTKAIKAGTGKAYDDTAIKTDINAIKTDLGAEALNTTAKDIKGAVNEVAAQYKDIAKKTIIEGNKLYLVKADGTKLDSGTALPTSSGTVTDGKEIELQKSTTHIQWRYVGDTNWINLVALSDLKGAKGEKGATGATPNLKIGTVTTLESGSNATASITGTTENPLLNLSIPKGAKGDKGDTGASSEGTIDTLVTTNISGNTLSLTTDKYQTTTIVDGTEITLPIVTSFTEIHLFFNTTTDLTLTLPACKWQNGNTPTISANKTYEFIFTYTTEWLGGVIAYE